MLEVRAGRKAAADREAHVKDYDVDVMNLQKAVGLVPAALAGFDIKKLCAGAAGGDGADLPQARDGRRCAAVN